MTDLPPFNDRSRCPKCSYDAVKTEYTAALRRPSEGGDGIAWLHRMSAREDVEGEHLIRVCARCNFTWREACVVDEPTANDDVEMTEREAHLHALGRHALASLYTWLMGADLGLDYDIHRDDDNWKRTYTSSSEILAIIGYEPEPDFDAGEEWPMAAEEYARELWKDLGKFLREDVKV
jgi:hypothetical protein